MEIFRRLFEALNKGGVEYLVCGGIAVNLYGIERATADLDLAVRLDEDNLGRFITAAKGLGLKPKMPVRLEDLNDQKKREGWRIEKGMVVFSLFDENAPFFLVNLLIDPQFDFKDAYRKRKETMLADIVIPFAPIEVLIGMKENTGRPQDKADVFYLRKIMEEWKDDK